QVFKGRVKSFSDVYKTGNFTVVLEKAQESDSGIYECHIPKVDFQQRVQLTVAGVKPTPPPGPRVGGGAVTLSSSVLALLSAPVFLFWL
ncbi:CXADR-like membrane protein, partial, partial [Lates japonicus]